MFLMQPAAIGNAQPRYSASIARHSTGWQLAMKLNSDRHPRIRAKQKEMAIRGTFATVFNDLGDASYQSSDTSPQACLVEASLLFGTNHSITHSDRTVGSGNR